MITINYTPATCSLTLKSESPSDILMIGRISAKAPASTTRTEQGTAMLEVRVEDLIKLAANGKL